MCVVPLNNVTAEEDWLSFVSHGSNVDIILDAETGAARAQRRNVFSYSPIRSPASPLERVASAKTIEHLPETTKQENSDQ